MRTSLGCAQARTEHDLSPETRRVLHLLTQPNLLEILVGLYLGTPPRQAAPDATEIEAEALVRYLIQVGAAHSPTAGGGIDEVLITPRGRWMVEVLNG